MSISRRSRETRTARTVPSPSTFWARFFAMTSGRGVSCAGASLTPASTTAARSTTQSIVLTLSPCRVETPVTGLTWRRPRTQGPSPCPVNSPIQDDRPLRGRAAVGHPRADDRRRDREPRRARRPHGPPRVRPAHDRPRLADDDPDPAAGILRGHRPPLHHPRRPDAHRAGPAVAAPAGAALPAEPPRRGGPAASRPPRRPPD